MAVLTYIIWNPNQTIFQLGSFAVRWYSLAILLAFLGGRRIVVYIYKKEGRPLEDADHYSIWAVFSALIGARLGEIIFYNFEYYLYHPIEAFLPVTFDPHLRITGYQGLSYHGAIVGTLIGTYLYANYHIRLQLLPPRLSIKPQKRRGQSFLWLSTPLALGMMMGFLVRVGNFINSEISGTSTQCSYGILFAHNVVKQLQNSSGAIERVRVCKGEVTRTTQSPYQPLTLEVIFKNAGYEEHAIKNFVEHRFKHYLVTSSTIKDHVYHDPDQPLHYTLSKTKRNAYIAHIHTQGIPRHPVQLYESLAYAITLLIHLYWWQRRHKSLPAGTIAGSAMVFCYSLRFIGEFFKEPFNILFEGSVILTMGHLLSLLTVLGGILLLTYSHMASAKDNRSIG